MSENPRGLTGPESIIDKAANRVLARLPSQGIGGGIVEFAVFGIKQAWACLFGALLLALMIATRLYWPEDGTFSRYDFLFLAAFLIQVMLLAFRLETPREASVIVIFHLVGTAMELYKTHMGSWSYPDPAIFRIESVPLFSGFMYAAVGSYMSRITRIFDIRLEQYPALPLTVFLALAVYANFFTHHFIYDFRYILMGAAILIFWRTQMHYRVHRYWHRMPILAGFALVTFFIWIAENIGTFTRTWVYPAQAERFVPVGPDKFGSWFLLMLISVVLVTLVHPPRQPKPVREPRLALPAPG